MEKIKDTLDNLLRLLKENIGEDLRAVILYGSWAKGTQREDSDIDILIIVKERDQKDLKNIAQIAFELSEKLNISIVTATEEDFQKECLPLYTAVKKEGIVLEGKADLSLSPASPEEKYARFFERSKEFESQKIRIAEKLYEEFPDHSSHDLCFIAAKHAIQASLAMKGLGYSSKLSVLMPLVKEKLGDEVFKAFRRLSELYIKGEYELEDLSREETLETIDLAKKILNACYKITDLSQKVMGDGCSSLGSPLP